MPRDRMPSTVKRSSKGAQDTYEKTLENAEGQYGPGARAHQTAYASLKHSYERKGDRWVRKARKGPSDSRSTRSPARGETGGRTHGGVDVLGNTREELYERARKLDIDGRSKMNKEELADAIAREQ